MDEDDANRSATTRGQTSNDSEAENGGESCRDEDGCHDWSPEGGASGFKTERSPMSRQDAKNGGGSGGANAETANES